LFPSIHYLRFSAWRPTSFFSFWTWPSSVRVLGTIPARLTVVEFAGFGRPTSTNPLSPVHVLRGAFSAKMLRHFTRRFLFLSLREPRGRFRSAPYEDAAHPPFLRNRPVHHCPAVSPLVALAQGFGHLLPTVPFFHHGELT